MVRSYKKPYRVRRKKSILKNRFFWFGILTLLILGEIFYLICFSSFFGLEKVVISGNETVSQEDIELIIEENLEKKILIFSSKSILLVNLKKIKEEILTNFPQIAELEINQELPGSFNVKVAERLKSAIWCRVERCFFLDKKGIIFEETSLEGDLVKIINKENGEYPVLGDKVIEKDYLEKILEIQKKLNLDIKIATEEFIISPEFLTVKTFEGWKIYFDVEKDINWQLTKLGLVLEKKILSENRGDLEYIELRFGNLAPFKYK